ncbi:fructosamine kinase family protein [Alteromonadaceae bacterium BrNp21-10]|nr:fructosamine kinase family protein [Alteromonadaceae bacterium BrNp21-10]
MWSHICQHISEVTQSNFACNKPKLLSIGQANQCYELACDEQQYFVKLAEKRFFNQLEAEVVNLVGLQKSQHFMVPKVICSGQVSTKSYLVLELLQLSKTVDEEDYHAFGMSLAKLHQFEPAQMYGWQEDNYIGPTVQPNQWHKKWSSFFAEQRIGYQLQLLKDVGHSFGDIDNIIANIKQLLHHYQPQASLLHGDLWHGNCGFIAQQPCIFDPACYYGDRETDIAMAELFGHFPTAFYKGYDAIWPLDSGYSYRKPIYQLYHVLNHALMFGDPYIASANSILINLES